MKKLGRYQHSAAPDLHDYQITIIPGAKGKSRTVIDFSTLDAAKQRARGLSHLACVVRVDQTKRGVSVRQWYYREGFLMKQGAA